MLLLWCPVFVLTRIGATQPTPLECRPRAELHLHTPLFHIMGRMKPTSTGDYWPLGATDGNAAFGHQNVFHIMHQTPNVTSHNPRQPTSGYWASWGHVLSHDAAHWQRIENALDPDFNKSGYDWHDGDCDGTVSFVPDLNATGGVIMTFGPDCARPVRHSLHATLGDAPRIGIARLTDPSDQNTMSRWVKDANNPISFGVGSPPCAFSGKIWRPQLDGNWSMLCAVNSYHNAWARYTTSDPSLHGPWHLADASFATYHGGPKPWPCTTADAVPPCPVGSISAPSFLPLPPYEGEQTFTHMINAGGGRAYILGRYDPTTQKLAASGRIQSVESMGSGSNWYVAGVNQRDKRLLHVGFFEPRDGALMYDWEYSLQQRSFTVLSLVRSLQWSAAHQRLLSNPLAELSSLRNGSLFHKHGTVQLPATGEWHELLQEAKREQGGAMDIELILALPPPGLDLHVELHVLASTTPGGNASEITLHLPATEDAQLSRHGNLSMIVPRITIDCAGMGPGAGWSPWGPLEAPFTVLGSETSLHLRVIVDRSTVEVFGGGGRAVVSTRDFPGADETSVRVRSKGADITLLNASGWSMGCGWTDWAGVKPRAFE